MTGPLILNFGNFDAVDAVAGEANVEVTVDNVDDALDNGTAETTLAVFVVKLV